MPCTSTFQLLCTSPPRTGNHVRVNKVAAYQYTLTAASSQGCDQALYEEWKDATGFDESVYQGTSYADTRGGPPRCMHTCSQLLKAAGCTLSRCC